MDLWVYRVSYLSVSRNIRNVDYILIIYTIYQFMKTDNRTSQHKQKPPKAFWKTQYYRIFVELCYREMLKGNKPGTFFSQNGQNNLVTKLRRKLGKPVL